MGPPIAVGLSLKGESMMKRSILTILNIVLVFKLIAGSYPAFGKKSELSADVIVPPVAGVDIQNIPVEVNGEVLNLPPALEGVADGHVRQENAAPPWVKKLQKKKVSEYFPRDFNDQSPNWQKGIRRLIDDATRLHEYYEGQDKSGSYALFVEKKLAPFIAQLTAKELRSAYRHKRVSTPIAEWTVEILVVTEQVAYLGRLPNFIKSALGLLVGRHLRGASAVAGVVVLGAIGAVTAQHFDLPSGWMVGAAIGSVLGGAFQAGPLAAILNAATAWFIQPTTEYIRVLSARFTGPWEQAINHFYDKFKPTPSGVGDAERNETPNIPTVERDGMDFAGMSAEEQRNNWGKNLRMWVAVAKTFGQLLRDTHHSGRVLMMVAWADEQLTTNLVETMDTKLLNLSIMAETILTPYKTAILANGLVSINERTSSLAQLQAHFDLLQVLSERKWMDLDLDDRSLAELESQVAQAIEALARAGMTDRDISRISEMQSERANAVMTIVTALTLNEIRSFNVAEANRNLEAEARQAQRVIRNGFHLQDYVNKYREQIQLAMRKMGYENSSKPLPLAAAGKSCASVLRPSP